MNELKCCRWWACGVLVLANGCAAPARRPLSDVASSSAMPKPVAQAESTKVRITTSLGNIVVELHPEHAPETVLNFVHYVRAKHYDGTLFHRIPRESIIQGGGYRSGLVEKPLEISPVAADDWHSDRKNERGTIALLRADTFRGTPSAQFYINTAGNPMLDGSRFEGRASVFGRVIEGMDVVDAIRELPVSSHENYAAGRSAVVPVDEVLIRSIRLITPFDEEVVRALLPGLGPSEEELIASWVAGFEKEQGGKMITTESGLRYIDLRMGRGPTPIFTDLVEFQYRGRLLDGTEFESTYQTKPLIKKVELLIKGLRETIMSMNEGGLRTVIVPPELGYGDGGVGMLIPPNAVLIYEIDLLEIH